MLGGHSAVEPPVPIPNTEVKCSHADGSATYVCVRVGHCQASYPKPVAFLSYGFSRFKHLSFSPFAIYLLIDVYFAYDCRNGRESNPRTLD